ncbi:Chitin deacetylase [Sinomonas atrocyanea]|uniref:Chitin deacetylase n=1 Tax=Sinomonas atrocyanea TaxID=37927 RepID=A0A127A9U3_9MICC|nr:polysaccharide deacetylase family protein [Sinomonas atrocyanea]AMM34462.1 Chitin deacetylase [Sinomonas atrocyanea]GEB65565.1 hypothetical protein SAT01_30130 [Sinomonas atrocyanea]GGG71091.1 hypothetical protein GCM10007172_24180 [Sinomonas atrocyanea]
MPASSYRDVTGYGANPPSFTWPGGTRVAVSLVINIEEGAERGTAPGMQTAFDYGARAGIWRILRTLDRHGAPATAFCCAVALEANPAVSAALVDRGYEIADHGYRWEGHSGLDIGAERDLIVASRDAIRASTGMRPTSWYSKDGLNVFTRRTLAAEGFDYESNSFNDDLPHWGPADEGTRLPVLPYAGDTNDAGLASQFPTGSAFARHLMDTLDFQLDDPRPGPSVMSVGLHPRVIGRPAYAGALDRFLSHAAERGAWIATRQEIVRWWLDQGGGHEAL